MLGDLRVGAVVDVHFTTRNGGVPTTLAGSPALAVYKGNSTTQSTSGLTLDVDFDGVTGFHHVRIDTSADAVFYAAGNEFTLVLTAGTVGGVSVAGVVVEAFSLVHRTNLTAAEVNAEADTALADVGVTGTVTGRIDAAITTRATQTSVDDIPTNAELATALGTADDAVLAILGTPAGASLAADIAAIEAQTDDIGVAGAGLTALASAANLATLAGYVDTEVAAIKAVTDALPNAGALTSLATAANLATVDTVVDAIKVQTDKLTFDVDNALDANIQKVNDVELTGDGTSGDPWGPV